MWTGLQLILLQTFLGQAISQKGRWSHWGEFAPCTVSCGGGIRTRVRVCIGGFDCIGLAEEVGPCSTQNCTPKLWSSWSPFTPCSVSCGGGKMVRHRYCASEFEPAECVGESFEAFICSTDDCPPSGWLEWSDFSPCSSAVGDGVKSRIRICKESECAGLPFEVQPCFKSSTSPMGEWTPFSPCTATCGNGIMTRSSTCPDSEDHRCMKPSKEVHSCFIRSCPERNCTYLDLFAPASGSPKDSSETHWKVLIESVGSSCAGTLISKQWILTAAHCVGPDSKVYVGASEYSERRCMRTRKKVIEEIRHPEYFNDIALLKLEEPLDDLPDSEISNIPSGLSVEVGSSCSAIAGVTAEDPPSLFAEVNLTILPWEACISSYGSDEVVGVLVNESGTLLCAGVASPTEGHMCRGYSGGALTCTTGGQTYIAGISSFGAGDGCKHPGIYVDVEKYSDWIRNITDVAGIDGNSGSSIHARMSYFATAMICQCWIVFST